VAYLLHLSIRSNSRLKRLRTESPRCWGSSPDRGSDSTFLRDHPVPWISRCANWRYSDWVWIWWHPCPDKVKWTWAVRGDMQGSDGIVIPQPVLRQVHSLFAKRVLHQVRFVAPSFNFQYPLFLRVIRSFLRLLPRLPVTYILPSSIFPTITYFRTQFLRKICPIQWNFFLCRSFLSFMVPCNTSSFLTRSVQLIFSTLIQHHI